MKRLLSYSTLCILTWLLYGCATLTLPEHQPAPHPGTAFRIIGAIAAKNQHHGWIANFTWVQYGPQDYQILLNGPLGSETIEITMQHGLLTYREGHNIVHSTNPETLLAKETGIRIPLSHLYAWIRGQPAPGRVLSITRSPLDEQDILLLKQAGFVIRYEQYDQHYPRKIRLEGHGLLIKIVIKHWDLDNPNNGFL